MSAVYILCQVLPGLFENEYYVKVNGSAAYYVNRLNVVVHRAPTDEVAVEGHVLGYVVDQTAEKTLVQLPGEAVVGGPRAWVENAAVTAA